MSLLETIALILSVLIVIFVVIMSIINAKKGKCSCGDCKNCPYSCNKKNKNTWQNIVLWIKIAIRVNNIRKNVEDRYGNKS